MSEITCWHCGNLIGSRLGGGEFVSKRKGRRIQACLPARIDCEECGRTSEVAALDKLPVFALT